MTESDQKPAGFDCLFRFCVNYPGGRFDVERKLNLPFVPRSGDVVGNLYWEEDDTTTIDYVVYDIGKNRFEIILDDWDAKDEAGARDLLADLYPDWSIRRVDYADLMSGTNVTPRPGSPATPP